MWFRISTVPWCDSEYLCVLLNMYTTCLSACLSVCLSFFVLPFWWLYCTCFYSAVVLFYVSVRPSVCVYVCACVRVCVRACVRACVCVRACLPLRRSVWLSICSSVFCLFQEFSTILDSRIPVVLQRKETSCQPTIVSGVVYCLCASLLFQSTLNQCVVSSL